MGPLKFKVRKKGADYLIKATDETLHNEEGIVNHYYVNKRTKGDLEEKLKFFTNEEKVLEQAKQQVELINSQIARLNHILLQEKPFVDKILKKIQKAKLEATKK